MAKTKDKEAPAKKDVKLSEKSLTARMANKAARKRNLVRYFNQTTDSNN